MAKNMMVTIIACPSCGKTFDIQRHESESLHPQAAAMAQPGRTEHAGESPDCTQHPAWIRGWVKYTFPLDNAPEITATFVETLMRTSAALKTIREMPPVLMRAATHAAAEHIDAVLEAKESRPKPKAGKCGRCEGCGKVANDEDGTPWTHWESLPQQSKLAVQFGLVRPIECPACRGTGKATLEEGLAQG
jgi:hypothetical protein